MTNIEAGRELDALIAMHVFGQSLESMCDTYKVGRCDGKRRTVCGACGRVGHGNCYGNGQGQVQIDCLGMCPAPAFSVNIKAAWQVVEKFDSYNHDLTHHGRGFTWQIYKDATVYEGTAETAPLAICRAALKAVGPEVPTESP